MVEVSAIVDEESLKAWFDGRPEETRRAETAALATRAAMRLIPDYVSVLDREWAKRLRLDCLPLLRCVLTTGASIYTSTSAIRETAVFLGMRIEYLETELEGTRAELHGQSSDINSELVRTNFCLAAAANATFSLDEKTDHLSSAALADLELLSEFQSDAILLELELDPFQNGLWSNGKGEKFGFRWLEVRKWLTDNLNYDFWVRWYEAAIEGRPLTGDWDSHWQMLRDIALIPNEDWEQGAERVAGLIDVIAEKNYLQRQVQDLKQRISDEIFNQQTLGQHSHNLPDDLPASRLVEYRIALNEAKDTLLELEEALEPPIPDPTLLAKLTEQLTGVCGNLITFSIAAVAAGFLGQAGVRGLDWLVDEGLPSLTRSIRESPVAAQKLPHSNNYGKQ